MTAIQKARVMSGQDAARRWIEETK